MNWNLLLPFAGLLIGCALRTLLPYVVTGLKTCQAQESWTAWPKFKPSYLASLGLTVLLYGVGLLTIPGAWAWTLNLDLVTAIGFAYTGQSITHESIKPARKEPL